VFSLFDLVTATFKLREEKQTQAKACDYQLGEKKNIFDSTRINLGRELCSRKQ